MNRLKFVKIIVFFLTFLLFFGALTALGTIYKKISNTTPIPNIKLNQPKGSFIADYKIEQDSIFILVKGGGDSDRILITNISDNKQPVATIKIN